MSEEATEHVTAVDAGSTDVTSSARSLEDLQRELAEMEAAQSQLASRLEQQTLAVEPRLDSRLAVIEEQFRQSFDERLRESSHHPVTRRGLVTDQLGHADASCDVLVVNRVFREVSRSMGDEWRPVFDALMSAMPPDVVDAARQSVEQHPALIQGYRCLLAWRQAAGAEFNIRRLVDVLRDCNMADVAELALALLDKREEKDQKTKLTKPVQRRKSDVSTRSRTSILDNRRMLLLAKKVGGDWEGLGKALGVAEDEIKEIKESADASSYQGAFKMLWAWRQSQTSRDEAASHEVLRAALQQVNKAQLID